MTDTGVREKEARGSASAEHEAPGRAGPGAWWRGLSTGQRVLAALLALVIGVNVLIEGIDAAVGSNPGGPVSSSLSTGSGGLEAYADLARVRGHEVVRHRRTPEVGDVPPEATLVLAEPRTLSSDDLDVLSGFLEDGGRLVLVGEATTPLVRATTGGDLTWDGEEPLDPIEVEVVGSGSDTAALGSLRRLAGDDGGRWSVAAGLDVLLADQEDRAVVVAGPARSGTVVAVSSAPLLQNANLASADNAALALALIGGSERPLHFYESVHGFGASGLDALPSSWKWSLAGIAVAAAAGLWWAGSRLGPPEPQARALRPARLEHVRAVAADLERVSARPADLVAPLLHANRLALAERLRVPPDASPEVWRRAAQDAGMDPAVVEAGTTAPVDVESALYVGRLAAYHRQTSSETLHGARATGTGEATVEPSEPARVGGA